MKIEGPQDTVVVPNILDAKRYLRRQCSFNPERVEHRNTVLAYPRWTGLEQFDQRVLVDCPATATIAPRPLGSIVEARGRKVLPVSAQSCAWRAHGRWLQVAEMSKEYANERNRACSVRHDS